MVTYIYDLTKWPCFSWAQNELSPILTNIHDAQKWLFKRMAFFGFKLREEAVLTILTEDILKSSEIENEILDKEQVRSSVARHLGMEVAGLSAEDRHVDGIVEMMLDATQNFDVPLTEERLFAWHSALFPTGRSGMAKIKVGMWRDDTTGPMQVISGAMGRERVHFQAPTASKLKKEMLTFLRWFNNDDGTDLILKSGIAHLWFVTIHPFDDGNGRIARAISDMLLARSEKSPQRFYSMSAQIQKERTQYYEFLESTQKGNLDITRWLDWFLGCLSRAVENTETTLASVFRKARFWAQYAGSSFNNRQIKIINLLLDGFEGKLTSSKWATIAKCSQDTALRDIEDLINRFVLTKEAAGGRSTHYALNWIRIDTIREIAVHTRQHADKSVAEGIRTRSRTEMEIQQKKIEALADELDLLAVNAEKGILVSYQDFEIILTNLHKNGCWPPNYLVSAVAFAFKDTY